MHFHVEQSTPVVVPDVNNAKDYLWLGDGIEVFAKGDDHLTGSYDGSQKDVGALQLLIVPGVDSPPSAARACIAYGTLDCQPYDSGHVASRLIAGGYELEVLIPWSVLHPATPAAQGGRIGLDFAADYRQRSVPTPADTQFQIVYAYDLSGRDASCAHDTAKPYCTDLVWCTPQLL